MLWAILIAIAAIVAIGATLVALSQGRKIRKTEKAGEHVDSDIRSGKNIAWVVAGIAGIIGAIIFIASTWTTVGTKNVGIVTAFNKPTGEVLSNGLHFTLPWESVHEFDKAIQTQNFVGKDGCQTVRLATDGTACVEYSVQWRIDDQQSDTPVRLFVDYRSFESMTSGLVDRQRVATLVNVFGTFDPLARMKGGDTESMKDVSTAATEELQARLKGRVIIDSVVITMPNYDEGTQAKINAFQAEVGATRIAEQSKLTAIAMAAANKELAASVSHDPNVLVSKCLDSLNDMVKAGQQVPAGFSCWPGGGSALVVPQTSASK